MKFKRARHAPLPHLAFSGAKCGVASCRKRAVQPISRSDVKTARSARAYMRVSATRYSLIDFNFDHNCDGE